MNWARREVNKSLVKKGFKVKESHHKIYHFYHREVKTNVRTYMSHGKGSEQLPSNLIAEMAKQCRLSRQEFSELVDCTLTYAGYVKILQDKGTIN